MTIQEFPLAWRWTQQSHAILPAAVIERIHPLDPAEAARAWSLRGVGNASKVSLSTADSVTAQEWLRRIQPDSHARVFVSWTEDLAIETTWDIFTDYWDDFCYPSSDDVSVIPAMGSWRLRYHRYERFEFSMSS